MRRVKIATGERYHLYNRGNDKKVIFRDESDYIRFLVLMLLLQSNHVIPNIHRIVKKFRKSDLLDIDIDEICKKRTVVLEAFVFMPNHFHLVIHQKKENGISEYMHRLLTAYTKYFNLKYDLTGHLFQGPFQAVYIQTNEQLLHLSAYVHRNPRELKGWKDKEDIFRWSSFQDYTKSNRWGELLSSKIVLKQFSDPKEYLNFVSTSGTKLLDEELKID